MSGSGTIPLFLYHYTSLDSLRLIVTNRTIRFTRSDRLNDLNEGSIRIKTMDDNLDFRTATSFYSSWTSQEEESVAMWYMYSKMQGVRIKLRYDMFLDKGSIILEDNDKHVRPVTPIKGIPIKTFPNSECTISKILGPIGIVYEKNSEIIDKRVAQKSVVKNGGNSEYVMNDIDLLEKQIRKTVYWEYEKEYRYIIAPYIAVHCDDDALRLNVALDPECPPCIYIPIFKPIEEVLLAPQITEEDKVEITSFLTENGITNIRESSVKCSFDKCF